MHNVAEYDHESESRGTLGATDASMRSTKDADFSFAAFSLATSARYPKRSD